MSATDPRWQKRWKYERAQGLTRTMPADGVREHLRDLRESGASMRAIADAAGLSVSCVSHLLAGQPTVRRVVAAAIMRVRLADIMSRSDDLGFVPKVGACRRIQALLALGWTHQHIEAAMRATDPDVHTHSHRVLHQAGEWIARATHDAVAGAYATLSTHPGPSVRTRARAARLGYLVPAMWDDDALDDPAATPAEVEPEQRGADLDDWLWLVRNGEHPERAARRLGVTLGAIEKAAIRHGRGDVLDRVYATGRRAAA